MLFTRNKVTFRATHLLPKPHQPDIVKFCGSNSIKADSVNDPNQALVEHFTDWILRNSCHRL